MTSASEGSFIAPIELNSGFFRVPWMDLTQWRSDLPQHLQPLGCAQTRRDLLRSANHRTTVA